MRVIHEPFPEGLDHIKWGAKYGFVFVNTNYIGSSAPEVYDEGEYTVCADYGEGGAVTA